MTPAEAAWWASIGRPELVFVPQDEVGIIVQSIWTGSLPIAEIDFESITTASVRWMPRALVDEWISPQAITPTSFRVLALAHPWVRTPENYYEPRPEALLPPAPIGEWYAAQWLNGIIWSTYRGGIQKWTFTVPNSAIEDAETYADTIYEAAIGPHLRHFGMDLITLTDPIVSGSGWSRSVVAARPPFGGPVIWPVG